MARFCRAWLLGNVPGGGRLPEEATHSDHRDRINERNGPRCHPGQTAACAGRRWYRPEDLIEWSTGRTLPCNPSPSPSLRAERLRGDGVCVCCCGLHPRMSSSRSSRGPIVLQTRMRGCYVVRSSKSRTSGLAEPWVLGTSPRMTLRVWMSCATSSEVCGRPCPHNRYPRRSLDSSRTFRIELAAPRRACIALKWGRPFRM